MTIPIEEIAVPSTHELPPIKKQTEEERKKMLEEMKSCVEREREIVEAYALKEKAKDLIPVLVHLYGQYVSHVREGGSVNPGFEDFMQWLGEREITE